MRPIKRHDALYIVSNQLQFRLRPASVLLIHTLLGPRSLPLPAAGMSELIKATTIMMHAKTTARLIFTAMIAVADHNAMISASSAQASLSFDIFSVLESEVFFG
jgi:hypothetical protein